MVDLEAVMDLHVVQHRAHGRMVDLAHLLDVLDRRIDDAVAVGEEGRQMPHADVAVLVDGGADDGAPVAKIPGRVVGPTAEQRDAKGRAADDHRRPPAEAKSATKASAAARVSGVPISMKRPPARNAARDVDGRRCSTSRSSEPRPTAEMRSSTEARNPSRTVDFNLPVTRAVLDRDADEPRRRPGALESPQKAFEVDVDQRV